MEKAIEFTGNLVILGDLNEDLFNHNYHNFQDALITDSTRNKVMKTSKRHFMKMLIHTCIFGCEYRFKYKTYYQLDSLSIL